MTKPSEAALLFGSNHEDVVAHRLGKIQERTTPAAILLPASWQWPEPITPPFLRINDEAPGKNAD
ncbi:hypothetical protein N8005_04625 [Litorivicinus sp.]|nr:hypothetical protein [Litorivicinus sp.]